MYRFQEKLVTDIHRQTDSWTEASTDKHEFIRPHLLRVKKIPLRILFTDQTSEQLLSKA